MQTNNPNFQRWLCLLTVPAVALYFAHVFIGSAAYPSYDWLAQAVSDLTAADSPVAALVSRYTALYGMLACLGCLFVALTLPPNSGKTLRLGIYLYAVMNWISYIGYTLFPLSGKGFQGQFQDIMHAYVVTVAVVLCSIVSLILIVIGGLRQPRHVVLSIGALLAFACMLTGAAGMGAAPHQFFGLFERFSVFSVVLFTLLLGLWNFFATASKRQTD